MTLQDALPQPSAAETAVKGAVSDPKFWARTRPEGECLVWTGYRDRQGYGSLLRKFVAPSPMLAHRYAWYLTHGELPGRAVIRHSCDNPPCVNPDHLLTGTQADNIADRQARGRHRPGRLHGEQHPAARLNDSEVMWMRRAVRFYGWRVIDIARDFGMDPSTVSRIVRGRNWSHLPLDGIEKVA